MSVLSKRQQLLTVLPDQSSSNFSTLDTVILCYCAQGVAFLFSLASTDSPLNKFQLHLYQLLKEVQHEGVVKIELL